MARLSSSEVPRLPDLPAHQIYADPAIMRIVPTIGDHWPVNVSLRRYAGRKRRTDAAYRLGLPAYLYTPEVDFPNNKYCQYYHTEDWDIYTFHEPSRCRISLFYCCIRPRIGFLLVVIPPVEFLDLVRKGSQREDSGNAACRREEHSLSKSKNARCRNDIDIVLCLGPHGGERRRVLVAKDATECRIWIVVKGE